MPAGVAPCDRLRNFVTEALLKCPVGWHHGTSTGTADCLRTSRSKCGLGFTARLRLSAPLLETNSPKLRMTPLLAALRATPFEKHVFDLPHRLRCLQFNLIVVQALYAPAINA